MSTVSISMKDKKILRELAKKVAEIASMPVQKQKKEMWTHINDLQNVNPMVFIYQIPWHEMNVNNELDLQTTDRFCKGIEIELRRTIYQWVHMRGDMVVEPWISCPLVIHDTGFGITEDYNFIKNNEDSEVLSKKHHCQIQNEEDIYKIKMPEITYDKDSTEFNYSMMVDIFDGILEVKKIGVQRVLFAPWDRLVEWWAPEQALMDLILRPKLIHKAMKRLVDAFIYRLDQYESQNLLSLNNLNKFVGTGGLGYTNDLPQTDYNYKQTRAADLWGYSMAQIFAEVSPDMHDEFALQYEIQWLKRFGLNYYGCCEPLHKKIDILKKIPNLRKISMSPWVNVEEGAEAIGDSYIYSCKPNPAILALKTWDLDYARKELVSILEKTSKYGCIVEVIMKDISTVRHQPQRLWEWARMASEITKKIL